MSNNVQRGTVPAPAKFRIRIELEGPYLVYGSPPLNQQFYVPDSMGEMWYYQPGDEYSTVGEPTALCRCGTSKKAPYCDGSHAHADWDPRTTASREPLLDGAKQYDGPTLTLTDNRDYCAFARFCDAKGQVWRLVGQSDDDQAREWTIREANRCPAGRLHAWDNDSDTPHEPDYEPSLALAEDPSIGCSGPLWVRGGIAIEDGRDGYVYEIRNRVTLCRCGQSSNKPYCDGTHASMKYRDGLSATPKGEKY
jgi:CDGSH-type Zn-finger protein